MKKQFHHIKNISQALLIITTLSSFAQNSFTHIANKENKSCNGNCSMLDIPQINGNPAAILFVTQKDQKSNPHPFCVYYFKTKWNIMNLDQAAIPEGAKFTVDYFINPGPDHFQYLIKKENLQNDGTALIDHPSLNNHPDAKFTVFHSWVPEAKQYANKDEINVHYIPQVNKWSVNNINKQSLGANIAYNFNITSAGNATTTPVNTNPVNTNPVTTTATGNSGSAPVSGLLYMTVWVNGIKLPGESLKAGHLDQVEVVDYELTGNTARESGSGASTGRRQYEPFTIKKLTGGLATIPYFNAFVLNQELVVSIDAYSISGLGIVELNYTIKLTGARIAGFKQTYENPNSNHSFGYVDVIKLSFTKIEYIKAGVSVGDSF